MRQLYCVQCARHFLNSMSIIRYETRNVNGNVIQSDEYRVRGFEAIAGLAKMMDNAEALGQTFTVEMNGLRFDGMLYATMLVSGTSVCLAHGETYDPMQRMTNPRGWPYNTPSKARP